MHSGGIMFEVKIQIGYGQDAERPLSEASDEWVWMRLYELRSGGLSSRLKFVYKREGCYLSLQTPRAKGSTPVRELTGGDDVAVSIIKLWEKLDMESADFTAGAAVLFLRRFRKLYCSKAA